MIALGPGSPRLRFPVLLPCCVLLFSLFVQAQSPEDQVHIAPLERPRIAGAPIDEPFPDAAVSPSPKLAAMRVDVDLVLVPVTVTDAMNRPLTALKKQQFVLREGGKEQQIRFFSMEDQPISLGVILDLSKSMSNKIATAREAVSQFFATSNPEDDYFVVTFADRPEVLADSTRSLGYIQSKLASASPGGHTALLDAIYLALHKMRHARYQRRALLIISDGGDNRSRYTANEIRHQVEEADIEIYAIGLFDKFFRTPEEWAGRRLLTDITEATGGRTATVNNVRELPDVAEQISRELRSRYLLGYRPSNDVKDGKWRKIIVQVAGADRVRVHHRKGYLAPEQ